MTTDPDPTMTSALAGPLDEAYLRLHETGPEFDGWLSNHGPMAAEALVRHGHGEVVTSWLDDYMLRLEEFPRGVSPIGTDWQAALGDPRRVADWTALFRAEISERPWRQVLDTWWPRLLPGVVAAATHGVIRVGHAVRCLLTDGDDEIRTAELAHGLAYWAARWQTMPAGHAGAAAAAAAGQARAAMTAMDYLASVPRIAEQSGGIRDRIARLDGLPGWPSVQAGFGVPQRPEQIRARLTEVVDAATIRYLSYGHGNAVMLVHSATAPNAVLRALPALDTGLWAPSLAAAWAAASALTAVYAPAQAAPRPARSEQASRVTTGQAVQDTFARAAEHGDEHVIKLADTAVEVFARTGNPDAIAAAHRAAELIER